MLDIHPCTFWHTVIDVSVTEDLMGAYIYHDCRGYMHTYVTQDGNPSNVLHKAIMENTANSKVKDGRKCILG